jgi:integrase
MPKIVKPLTDKQVENAQWKSPENRDTKWKRRLYDGGGLYLELTPTGGKLWRFKYQRPEQGDFSMAHNIMSFGRYPDVSLSKARERRDQARRSIADGVDPVSARRQADREAIVRATNTFEAVAREWHEKRVEPIRTETHARDVLRRLEANLFPDLGALPIAEIKAPDILCAVRKIEERAAHDLAHRVLGVASQVFRYGVATGRCERDPARDLRGALTTHVATKQPAVKPDDVPALLRSIAEYDKIGNRQTKLALRLLALTAVRTGELIGATWDEFDIDGAEWVVPAERMKGTKGERREHVVPLARQALAVVEELRTLACGSRFVLPGRNPDKPISNNTMLFALYRLGYKGRQTGHGFRAIASTLLNESGKFRHDVIERQLAHVERNKVRAAYNRSTLLPERRAMMQAYADMLDNLERGAQVIPLQRARGAR